jgi:hypothetical protein
MNGLIKIKPVIIQDLQEVEYIGGWTRAVLTSETVNEGNTN